MCLCAQALARYQFKCPHHAGPAAVAMAARQRDGAGSTSGGGPRSPSPDGGDRGSSRGTSGSDSATGSEEEALEGYRKGADVAQRNSV